MTKLRIEMITESIDAYNCRVFFKIYDQMKMIEICEMTREEIIQLESECHKILIHYGEGMIKW